MIKKKKITFRDIKCKKYPLLIDEHDPEDDIRDMEYINDMVKDSQKYKREHHRHREYNE